MSEEKEEEKEEKEEEKKSLVEKYLKEIAEAAGGHDCIYRGQANDEWDLESAAERRIRKAIKKEESVENKVEKIVEREAEAEVKNEVEATIDNEAEKIVEDKKSFTPPKDSLTSYHKNLLDDARHKGFGIRDGRRLSDLELLAELQHFGAATCLLDFTESPLVALYIACIDTPEKDGKLFILRNANLNTVLENDPIKKIIESGDLLQWQPPMHGEAERRIIRQSGVFIINLKPDEKNLLPIDILSSEKEKILEELDAKYQISADTLFIDLAGFAKNHASEQPLSEALGAFYRGNISASKEEWVEAIKYYDKAIRLKPDYVDAYFNSGHAKLSKEYWDKAIKDYDEAIRLKPDFSEAYFNRGVAKSGKGDFDGAIVDYNEAIRLNSDFAVAYFNRAFAKAQNGDMVGAIKDYDEAIRLNPDNVIAHFNRSFIKAENKDWDGAIKGYSQTIRLKPDFVEAYFNRSHGCYYRSFVNSEKENLPQAQKDAEEALRLAELQNSSSDFINKIKRFLKTIEDEQEKRLKRDTPKIPEFPPH
ncbi:MAG: tetratricopeptide repeat protein [Gammaproteobacteria bacterium]